MKAERIARVYHWSQTEILDLEVEAFDMWQAFALARLKQTGFD
ncbi:MAG: hypothetical protein AAGK66_02755 [Pseudomonadota bacterium]